MREQGKKPTLALVADSHVASTPPNKSERNDSTEGLARGVHKERSTYAGYAAYKAASHDGLLVAHLVVKETLADDSAVKMLWQMIHDYENHVPPLTIDRGKR